MAHDDRPLCDHQVDVDDATWFECELPMHHPGDHEYTFTWPNEPHGPKLPPKPLTPQQQAQQEWFMAMYGKMIERSLKTTPLVLEGAQYAPYIACD